MRVPLRPVLILECSMVDCTPKLSLTTKLANCRRTRRKAMAISTLRSPVRVARDPGAIRKLVNAGRPTAGNHSLGGSDGTVQLIWPNYGNVTSRLLDRDRQGLTAGI